MADQKEKAKKSRLAEVFTKDYKYEGLVLLVLAIIAIILGAWFLVQCYNGTNPFEGAFFLDEYPLVFSWLLTGLGTVSLLLSVWPYYKPSIYEVKRITWPTQKEMLENTITTFVFSLIFVFFFLLVDSGITALIDLIIR